MQPSVARLFRAYYRHQWRRALSRLDSNAVHRCAPGAARGRSPLAPPVTNKVDIGVPVDNFSEKNGPPRWPRDSPTPSCGKEAPRGTPCTKSKRASGKEGSEETAHATRGCGAHQSPSRRGGHGGHGGHAARDRRFSSGSARRQVLADVATIAAPSVFEGLSRGDASCSRPFVNNFVIRLVGDGTA